LTRSRFVGIGILFAFVLGGGAFYLLRALPNTPEEALHRFHVPSEVIAEDQIMDPLILAGKTVVPLLLKEIQDKNMPRRRYGIAALGHLGDSSALPALERILKDPSEIDYFRCDALQAIALLDPNAARILAKEQTASSVDCINQLSGALANGTLPTRRTYLQALVGWHQ
jgi:hypothetical protein